MRPDEIKSARKFDEGAPSYAAICNAHNSSGHSWRARLKTAHSLLGNGGLGRLLDIGGASGVYFEKLRSQAETYHIVDISPRMIGLAARMENRGNPLTCYVASVYDLPFSGASFNTILAMGVFEYLDDPWQALAEVARVAKPGGNILVSFTNMHSPMRRLSRLIYRLAGRKDPFTRLFTVKEVLQAGAGSGLKAVSVKGYNAQLIPFPFTWRLEWFAYVSAVLLEPLLNRFGALWGTAFIVQFRK